MCLKDKNSNCSVFLNCLKFLSHRFRVGDSLDHIDYGKSGMISKLVLLFLLVYFYLAVFEIICYGLLKFLDYKKKLIFFGNFKQLSSDLISWLFLEFKNSLRMSLVILALKMILCCSDKEIDLIHWCLNDKLEDQ